MDHKLATQLKNAGFPQNIKHGDSVMYKEVLYIHTGGGHLIGNGETEGLYYAMGSNCCFDDETFQNYFQSIYDKDVVKIPTLSELIEACGDGFVSLELSGQWRAYAYKDADRVLGTMLDTDGCSTPEEAVALLYLELKK